MLVPPTFLCERVEGHSVSCDLQTKVVSTCAVLALLISTFVNLIAEVRLQTTYEESLFAHEYEL